jgi:hypothetical protein
MGIQSSVKCPWHIQQIQHKERQVGENKKNKGALRISSTTSSKNLNIHSFVGQYNSILGVMFDVTMMFGLLVLNL